MEVIVIFDGGLRDCYSFWVNIISMRNKDQGFMGDDARVVARHIRTLAVLVEVHVIIVFN